MSRIPRLDSIVFLVDRKFPQLREPGAPSLIRFICEHALETQYAVANIHDLPIVKEYERKLRSLDSEEFLGLFETEKMECRVGPEITREDVEWNLYFYMHESDVDFEHWSRAAYWTVEEAVSLLFGKDPGRFNWEEILRFQSLPSLPFLTSFEKTRELALRAQKVGQLDDQCSPKGYVKWAKYMKIDMPGELVKLIDNLSATDREYQLPNQNESSLSSSGESDGVSLLPFSGNTLMSLQNQSPYFQKLVQMIEKALEEYPSWEQSQKKVQSTKNLQSWLTGEIGADNREAEILKKILKDFHKI